MVNQDLGKTIRILRNAKELKLSDLAREADISAPFLSLIENGQRQPSMEVTRRLSAALGVPSEVLILISVGPGTDLKSSNRGAERIARSVDELMRVEERLRDLLGSEDTTDAMERHNPS